MYYLILIEGNSVKIVRNWKKRQIFMPILFAYLKLDSIKYVEEVDEIVESGKYCVPTGLRTFQIIDATIGSDGYVFAGERCLRPMQELHVVHYNYSKINDKYHLNKELKLNADL